MSRRATALPQRGTRPRNRRELVVAAASDMLSRSGYDQVSMDDIADSVGIGASALYRHFSGKQDLLRAVVADSLGPVREVLGRIDLTDRDTAFPRLGALALDQRHLGVLWQREARRMADADYAATRAEFRGVGALLGDAILRARPELTEAAADLLGWSTIAALTSISFHHLVLPRPGYEELLGQLASTVLETGLDNGIAIWHAPAPPSRQGNGGRLIPRSRREALLSEAVRMFARQGYAGVSMEDIGAAVGIAGPSIYNHFASKRELLVTALARGSSVLFMDLTTTYAVASDARDALCRLVRSYVRFTLEHHDLVDLMITEMEQLDDAERRDARQAQHDYVSEWVHLLQHIDPALDQTVARIRVHAALSVANDTARTPHLRRSPDMPAAIEAVCTRLLQLPQAPPSR